MATKSKEGVREKLTSSNTKVSTPKKPEKKPKAPVFYMSVLPSHKSQAKYFTMMNDRVVVESLKNGVAGGDLTPEQERHFEYLKNRFSKYLVSSTDVKTTVNPSRRKEYEEKVRKIRQGVGEVDQKLAKELTDKLKAEYGF